VRFVLVHHGEIDPDGALTETGRAQAQAIGAELGNTPVGVLYAPGTASEEAATLIATVLGVAAPEPRDELVAQDGDSVEAAQERAWQLIEAAKTELEPTDIQVMVTTEPVIRAMVCRALGMPLDEMGRFALDAGSMTTIEWRVQPRERLLLAALNEVCHLDAAH
jgi:broad specificity phosphatase PhoE